MTGRESQLYEKGARVKSRLENAGVQSEAKLKSVVLTEVGIVVHIVTEK